jgi:hypothetical protein
MDRVSKVDYAILLDRAGIDPNNVTSVIFDDNKSVLVVASAVQKDILVFKTRDDYEEFDKWWMENYGKDD